MLLLLYYSSNNNILFFYNKVATLFPKQTFRSASGPSYWNEAWIVVFSRKAPASLKLWKLRSHLKVDHRAHSPWFSTQAAYTFASCSASAGPILRLARTLRSAFEANWTMLTCWGAPPHASFYPSPGPEVDKNHFLTRCSPPVCEDNTVRTVHGRHFHLSALSDFPQTSCRRIESHSSTRPSSRKYEVILWEIGIV